MASFHGFDGPFAATVPHQFTALRPQVRAWAIAEAAKVKALHLHPHAAAQMIRAAARSRFHGQVNNDQDIEAIISLVLMQVAQDAESDLRSIMNDIHHATGKRKTLRDMTSLLKGDLDALSEIGEDTSLRLQMLMDRRSKYFEALSNIMRKASNTSSDIVGNLK